MVNLNVNKLFLDFEGTQKNEFINLFIGFFLGVILLGVFNNIPEQQANATIFFIMLIVWGFIGLFDIFNKRAKKLFVVYGIGKNFVIAFAVGALLGFFLFQQGQGIIPIGSIVDAQQLNFFFISIIAPFVEANFFRGLLMGNIFLFMQLAGVRDHFTAGVIALVGQAITFAWFHTVVVVEGGASIFPSDPSLLAPYFVFGIVAGLGVLIFKSIAFEYGLHGVNNFLAGSSMGWF